MTRRLTICALALVLGFMLAACGDTKKPLEVVDWPYLEKPAALKVNGTELRGFVLKSEMQRRRGRNGLAVKQGEA
ncbi:MAG TPA: hypothetical protein PLF37_08730, partial [Planctomycetota bacterium]|nr:hypothetical protein [Planctomycetota bacterium]